MRNLKKFVAVGMTTAMVAAMSVVAMASQTITVHFKNAANWENVGCWAYEGVAYTTQIMPQDKTPAYNTITGRAIWPGAKMEAEQSYDGWYSLSFEVEDLAANGAVFMFNNLVADTTADTSTGGDATDQQFLEASGLIMDSSKKKQTQGQLVIKGSTAKEYWCDFDGVIPCPTGKLLTTAPASYKKKASTVVNNLAAEATSAKEISLTWDKYKDAAGYTVFYYNGKSLKKIGTTTKHSYKVTKVAGKALTAGKAYKFAVKATDKSGKSIAQSADVSACSLEVPTVSSAKNSAKGTVTVKAKAVSKADGYVVLRAAKEKGEYTQIGVTSNGKVTYTDKTAKKGKTYYYKVAAYKTVSGTKSMTVASAKAVKVKVTK